MANFSNARLAAEPCELMRGCTFADNFVTLTRIALNNGADTGTGNTADQALTTDGNGWITYEPQPQSDTFSVVINFSASSLASGDKILVSNVWQRLINGSPDNGFTIWVDADGVKANHRSNATLPTQCEVDLDYSDGVSRTVTYVVDLTGGTHTLYVAALDADSQTTTVTGTIGSRALTVSGFATYNFAGTVNRIRIFDQLLTESEHDMYHTDRYPSMFWNTATATARYKMDSFGDDAVGNYIWDMTLNLDDLTKGDRVTASTFPTFQTDKYQWDLVDDYISDWPTWPAAFTVTAALSTPQEPYPYISQTNDNSLTDLLDTSGAYWGYVHNLSIFPWVLNQLQLYHAEYRHMYWLERGRAKDLYIRLITENTCKMAMFLDSERGAYYDYSQSENTGIGYDVTRNGTTGCTFDNAASHVLVPQDTSLASEELTLYAELIGAAGVNSTIIDKGTNYKLRTTATHIDFNGSTIAYAVSATDYHLAVTCKSGYEPRFYVNNEYIGDGSSTVTPDDTDTTNLTIGNNNELNERCQHTLKKVYIGDKALSDRDIKALGQSSVIIGETAMEVGSRVAPPVETFPGVVDYDKDPGDAFQLIDVVMTWNVAPTTSEPVTIFSLRESVKVTEETYDPSLSSSLVHQFRFDKRFADGVTYGVDYANSDTNSVKVYSTYQLDTSV
jgi:hypothetical protein